MKQTIAIKKLNGLVVTPGTADNQQLAATLMASLMSQGFIMDNALFDAAKTLSERDASTLFTDVMKTVSQMKGSHVKHQPMYPNFPQQVMEASHLELFLNAILHYWSDGTWLPDYQALPRDFAFEKINFRKLTLVTETQFRQVFAQLVGANDSLSEEDKEFIAWFMENEKDLVFPETIPFKENMCVVAGLFLKAGKSIDPLVKTATDVLRIVTFLNQGDVSLAENTKFKTMPRSQRRLFATLLDRVTNEEDINRHRNKWVRLFHSLHIGEYSPKLFEMAKKIRNNQRIETHAGRVQAALGKQDLARSLQLLTQRPSEYARRLDHLLRLFEKPEDQQQIITTFLQKATEIPTRIVTQVMGHLQNRRLPDAARVVFPKGSTQKAQSIKPHPYPLNREVTNLLLSGLEAELHTRFAKLPVLGKVWIDPALKQCPIPSQQRSASKGLFSVARGTRLPFGDNTKNTLRFFVHWIGQDIDLSATLHDKDFKMMEQISWTHLKSDNYESCHSGDIVNGPAPHGATEFIDITVDKAVKYGARYVVMNVFVFRGPNFKDHEECFAGWMMRTHPNKNELYDPKTVEQKIDITAASKNVVPVVFDLVERKAIWTDLSTSRESIHGSSYGHYGRRRYGNSVESNRATIQQTLGAIVEAKSKLSLYELFRMHAEARGQLVTERKDAETVFGLRDGASKSIVTPFNVTKNVTKNVVTPFNVTKITSDFLA